ncbi:hypothetical protein Tco_0724100 [Tanacetum coccineum]
MVSEPVARLVYQTLTARITDEIRQNENNGNNVNRRNARRVNTGGSFKAVKSNEIFRDRSKNEENNKRDRDGHRIRPSETTHHRAVVIDRGRDRQLTTVTDGYWYSEAWRPEHIRANNMAFLWVFKPEWIHDLLISPMLGICKDCKKSYKHRVNRTTKPHLRMESLYIDY